MIQSLDMAINGFWRGNNYDVTKNNSKGNKCVFLKDIKIVMISNEVIIFSRKYYKYHCYKERFKKIK